MREDPYDLMKILDKYYVIFPYGIDGVFVDISMLNIEIIEIENKMHTLVYWEHFT